MNSILHTDSGSAGPAASPRPRLLVTGATGFIGSRLALHAQRLGMDVRATGRAATDHERTRLQELQQAGVAIEAGELQNPGFGPRIMRDRTAVIHLAAAQHEAHLPDEWFRTVNVGATQALLTAARDAGIARFVYGSTIGVYGGSYAAQCAPVFDEDSQAQPQNIYGRTKLEAEALVRAYAADFACCVVRISETYGPGDLRLLKLFRAIDRGHCVMLGAGRNRRQVIYIGDLIRGLLLAAQHPAARGQTINLAGQTVMTTHEMILHIAHALHRKPPQLRLPLWPFVTAATALEATLRPLRIQAPLHPRRLDFFRKSFVLATERASGLLGFRAETDFQTGAAETARWYRAHGYLPSRAPTEFADQESA
jgi:nucleoside-diphosphate-sugar epimerase